MSKKKLWLTYAWKDNEDKDIDFIVQELDKTSIDVRFDRRNLAPGQRLWTQIGGTITEKIRTVSFFRSMIKFLNFSLLFPNTITF